MKEKKSRLPRYGTDVREDYLGYGEVKDNRNQKSYRSRRAVRILIFFAIWLLLTVYIVPKFTRPFPFTQIDDRDQQLETSKSNSTSLVPLEAHIMSKCPDAKDCLVDLVVPAMEQIVDKVDFTLSYIGNIASDGTVECKHGGTECLGNMLGLCAAELFPKDIKRSLGFSTCMIMSYEQIPSRDLVERCSLEHGIPFDDLNACISEEGKGLDLLEASVVRTQKAEVLKSCTVRVAGEIWCIRDGAEWKNCPNGHEVKDLVQAVNHQYQNST